jgi:hypothetical protein
VRVSGLPYRRLTIGLVALSTGCSGVDSAKAGIDSTRALTGGNELAHPFTQLLGVVELPDGRLIAHDLKEPTLV